MEQHQNASQAASAASDANAKNKEVFERFMSAFHGLKELDLTDIEPLLPPTYKESRYRTKE